MLYIASSNIVHMALHVASFFFFTQSPGPDNRGLDNRGSTVLSTRICTPGVLTICDLPSENVSQSIFRKSPFCYYIEKWAYQIHSELFQLPIL